MFGKRTVRSALSLAALMVAGAAVGFTTFLNSHSHDATVSLTRSTFFLNGVFAHNGHLVWIKCGKEEPPNLSMQQGLNLNGFDLQYELSRTLSNEQESSGVPNWLAPRKNVQNRHGLTVAAKEDGLRDLLLNSIVSRSPVYFVNTKTDALAFLSIPLWPIQLSAAGLFMFLVAARVNDYLRRRLRMIGNNCISCGYSLVGLTVRCPECGLKINNGGLRMKKSKASG